MKKALLILFFTGHLLLIFFQSIWTTIDGFWSFHYNKRPYIPVFNLLKQNQYTDPYYFLTGTDTGYGFYGIHASTEKYVRATYLDSLDRVIKTDRYFNLSSTNGISRLEGYASFLVNYVAETKKIIEADTSSIVDNSPDVLNLRTDYKFRKDYVVKTLKWLGKKEASDLSGCTSYKVELLTIVPVDIWERKERKTKPKIYVVQEGTFPVQ
ncbi:hypothetical protein LS482_03085 [Sinomicrobium kalidii]|uniref:hypothetical protein n=1 Tax=Sinomicrobium kalidii TaxID=2900738 RepID=UPI001E4E6E78|nr:hypothetical protein [Sinomicrobium kalidii]UGU16863.1 hypothetical protein LS482_03085 [Sinomicrobium kalidii]